MSTTQEFIAVPSAKCEEDAKCVCPAVYFREDETYNIVQKDVVYQNFFKPKFDGLFFNTKYDIGGDYLNDTLKFNVFDEGQHDPLVTVEEVELMQINTATPYF